MKWQILNSVKYLFQFVFIIFDHLIDSREAIVHRMADDMLRKLPRDYIPHEVKESLVRLGGLLPMNIFLRQEIDRMQKILTMGEESGKVYLKTFL